MTVRYAKKAGDIGTAILETSHGPITLEITYLPYELTEDLWAAVDAVNRADLGRREQPEIPTAECRQALRAPLAEIARRAVRRVIGLVVGGVDLETLEPEEWSPPHGGTFDGLGEEALQLLRDAGLLQLVAVRAMQEQTPSVIEGEPCGSSPPPGPATSHSAAPARAAAVA